MKVLEMLEKHCPEGDYIEGANLLKEVSEKIPVPEEKTIPVPDIVVFYNNWLHEFLELQRPRKETLKSSYDWYVIMKTKIRKETEEEAWKEAKELAEAIAKRIVKHVKEYVNDDDYNPDEEDTAQYQTDIFDAIGELTSDNNVFFDKYLYWILKFMDDYFVDPFMETLAGITNKLLEEEGTGFIIMDNEYEKETQDRGDKTIINYWFWGSVIKKDVIDTPRELTNPAAENN